METSLKRFAQAACLAIGLALPLWAGPVSPPAGNYITKTGPITIATNTTWTGSFFIPSGSTITINNGVTLTINGVIMAGPYQIFAGSGHVTFLYQSAFTNEVYPEWWGAKGDNATDDTSAIQAAINSLAFGGKVALQGKIYLVSNTITISSGSIGIQGLFPAWFGQGGSTIRTSASNTTILSIAGSGPSAQINSNFVRDVLLLHGTGPSDDTNSSGAGIAIAHTVRTLVTDVVIVGMGTGLDLNHVVDGVFTNVKIHRIFTVPAGSIYGIYLHDDGINPNASDTFRDMIIAGAPVDTGTFTGVYYSGTKLNDLYFENTEIDSCEYGISLTITNTKDLNYDIKIDKPVIDNYRIDGISLDGFNFDGGATIMNGWFAPAAGLSGTVAAIKLHNSKGIKIEGAEFVGISNASNTAGYGILALGIADSLITGNTFRDFYTQVGITDSTRTVTSYNSFQSTYTAANHFYELSGISSQNLVSGNVMTGVTNVGIFMNTNTFNNTASLNIIDSNTVTTPIQNIGTANAIISQTTGGNISISNQLTDSSLSANVDLLASTQTFSAQKLFNSPQPSTFTYGMASGSITVTGLTASNYVLTDANKLLVSQSGVPATDLTGTILDARLSSNVDLLNSTQTFSAQKLFNSPQPSTFTYGVVMGSGTINSWEDFIAQASNPPSPVAGVARFHSATTQGFTRFEQDNEAATNLILGRDSVFIAKNTSGGAINVGNAVYITGATGSVPNVSLALGSTTVKLPAMGLALDSISSNAFGQIMVLGIINNINTSAFSVGDSLYVSTFTAGALTNVRPIYPNIAERVGVVEASGVGNGAILVDIAPFLGGRENGSISDTFTLGSSTNTTIALNAVGTSTFTYAVKASSFIGNGANLTAIPAAQISAGSLGSSVIASSITLSSMYGAPTLTGTNFTSLPGAQVGSGVPAANIATGSLGANVIASSITLASMYGAPTLTGTNFTSLPGAQVTSGVPAANIAAGSLGSSVIASSHAANSVGSAQIASPIVASSMTSITADSSTVVSTFGKCIVGSTLTLTTNNVPVDIEFTGDLGSSNNSAIVALNVLIDGANFDEYTSGITAGIMGIAPNPAADYIPASFSIRTKSSLSAGSHTFCLQLATNAGTAGILRCTTVLASCKFQVREVR